MVPGTDSSSPSYTLYIETHLHNPSLTLEIEALAVTIYAVLAEQKRVDRRVLLTLCGLGTALDDLFRLCIYTNPLVFDIKWIWYRGLLALIGGGERFYKMLATVMIAENVGGREM